jgi:hypothetical protein
MIMKKIILGLTIINTLSSVFAKDCIREDIIGSGIGDVKYSSLGIEKFQEINGKEWVVLAGQGIDRLAETDPEITEVTNVFDLLTHQNNIDENQLPDSRGVFLRGRNYNRDKSIGHPGGDKRIGVYKRDRQEFMMAQNDPNGYSANNHTHGHGLARIQRQYKEHAETSVRNITVNIFVKVRPSCLNKNISDVLEKSSNGLLEISNQFKNSTKCDFPSENRGFHGRYISKEEKFQIILDQFKLFESGDRNWSINYCVRNSIGAMRYLVNGHLRGEFPLKKLQLEEFRDIRIRYRWLKDEFNFEN